MTSQPDFSTLPRVLRDSVTVQWQDFVDRKAGPVSPILIEQLPRVWAASPLVARCCAGRPGLLVDEENWLVGEPATTAVFGERVRAATHEAQDEATLQKNLRALRMREMLRIAWRDLAGIADLDETLHDLTAFADASLEGALQWLEADMAVRYGLPRDARGTPVRLTVLAMGKLGGGELNFSSDIDLIFAFRDQGETDGEKPLRNEIFFLKLAQRLIKVLHERTADGFVFRVDTRLRPFGDSGPLVMNFTAMEDYYQSHGRDWERYALVKARPVAGDVEGGETLLRTLRPFIYRRYLDFTAFESLREMKQLIQSQVARKGLEDHIKLGGGGIREVEFIAQAFQLIRGGQNADFRQRNLRKTLRCLGENDQLPEQTVSWLDGAYVFLRKVENRLQSRHDEQTHVLPSDAEGRVALALAMGYEGWDKFASDLGDHRRRVEEQFQQVFAAPQTDEHAYSERDRMVKALWEEGAEGESARSFLDQLGFEYPEPVLRALQSLTKSTLYRELGERGRARLGQLMPLLFAAADNAGESETVLIRLLQVVEAVAGRGTYIALLLENSTALSQLARLCAASPWITGYIAQHPILLDELLDPRTLYSPPRAEALAAELASHGPAGADVDFEAEMDDLRRFKQSHTLRVASADITANMPLMVVSDHLTELAEVVLRRALELAWARTAERYGRPLRSDGSEAAFSVVAYGKLGGIELGYGSDLDLVFLHDGDRDEYTDGDKALEHPVFFARLGQRVIHILSTRTAAGQIYEVDVRLRPSGKAGLLVSHFDGYAAYQRNDAWTWEHQALVRARGLAGDKHLIEQFDGLRAEILGRRRDARSLREEVLQMRDRMRSNLEQSRPGYYDLKQGRGGMTDIEFLVQYAVLRWAADHPVLLEYTDNIRLLETLAEEGLLAATESGELAEAYRTYRTRAHRSYLRGEPALAEEGEYAEQSRAVVRAWERMLVTHTEP